MAVGDKFAFGSEAEIAQTDGGVPLSNPKAELKSA
jgi:hypothetical protein